MKKIILFTLLLISIPFLIVINYNNTKKEYPKEIQLNYMSNIKVRLKRNKTNSIDIISLEDYITGVVAGEMPALFELEALKAQAVASRSYVLSKIEENKNKEYDVIDTTQNQVYLDEEELKEKWQDKYIEYINKIKKSVNDTNNEYLSYDGKVINAMFFSTSNGYTEDAYLVFKEEVPYLKSVESSWDKNISSSFNYKKEFTKEEFYKKLNIKYSNKLQVTILEKSKSNRVLSLKINNNTFTGRDLYDKLALRSTDFTIYEESNKIIIETKGFGHGVGMSQYGAEGMAKAGYNYKEILNHYYTNTEIKKL